MKKTILFGGLLLLLLSLLTECGSSGVPSGGTFLNLSDEVGYVGMETCRSCHANVYETFIQTGMGRAFKPATPDHSAATFGAHALVYDSSSNFYYFPFVRDSALHVLEFRLENGDTVYRRTERIAYIVGSGQHTNSHIVSFGGYLFQAPVTFYTQEGKWDMAPGFRGDNLRFSRLLDSECITCHNHYPEHIPGSLNKFGRMPQGIECERCHGPGALHVREKLAGKLVDTATQTDYTIVNPAKLPRDLQMDLCQRCHLQGVTVLKEGKTFYDFRPGMRLSEVFDVFLPRYTDSHEKFIMASQADRLRLSPCYRRSELSCITCHNPHVSVERTDKDHFNSACLGCHARHTCTLAPADQHAEPDGCVGCHMPRSGSIDIPHVSITDHFISRQTARRRQHPDTPATQEPPRFLGLRILTKARATPLEMAKGYLALYDKYVPSPVMLDSAWHYLQRCEEPPEVKRPTLVHYLFAREDYPALCRTAASLNPQTLDHAWTAYRLGEGCYRMGDYPRAFEFFQRATELLPLHLDFQDKRAVTLLQMGRFEEARRTFEWVLSENHRRPETLTNLGYLWALQRRWARALAFYDRALALDPDYVQALLNKSALLAATGKTAEARPLLRRILQLEPANEQALQLAEKIRLPQ